MTNTTAHPTSWPTQLMLPGQAAAPDGPVDMKNMYLFHHAFRRDLDRFCLAVRRTPLAERETWALLRERWTFFAGQLHHHHEAEDRVLWPWLEQRTTPAEREVLAAMQVEHESVDPGLESVGRGFTRLAEHEDHDEQAALVVRLSDLRAGLDQHLAHEETDAMAILQRVTTTEDWKVLEKELGKEQPASGILAMLPWITYGIDPVVHAGLMAKAPLPLRILDRLLSPRFARREARVFAYA